MGLRKMVHRCLEEKNCDQVSYGVLGMYPYLHAFHPCMQGNFEPCIVMQLTKLNLEAKSGCKNVYIIM